MKILLSWLYDHLQGQKTLPRTAHEVHDFARWYSTHVCEVAHVAMVQLPANDWYAAQVTGSTGDTIHITIPELSSTGNCTALVTPTVGDYYLVTRTGTGWRLVTYTDLGLAVGAPLPALYPMHELQTGAWRSRIDTHTAVWTFDNISLTHRPDLWGHRGHAREALAYLGGSLRTPEELVAQPVSAHQNSISPQRKTTGCSLLATAETTITSTQGIYLPWTIRLALVGSKSHGVGVDVTNYTMIDWGYPLHMFDAKRLHGSHLTARAARAEETLTLLDGSTIDLTPDDIVIADAKGPLSLAGIMGGTTSSVHPDTTHILLEAGHFEATSIRLSSKRHKVRTESSTRFEKGLDPLQAPLAISRALALLQHIQPDISMPGVLVDQEVYEPQRLTISHHQLERLIGTTLSSDTVIQTLALKGYGMRMVFDHDGHPAYDILVPSWRAHNDTPTHVQDIIEEVLRTVGYDQLPACMPAIPPTTVSDPVYTLIRTIEPLVAYSICAQQITTYPVTDQAFQVPVYTLANPLAQGHDRLTASLIPGMLAWAEKQAALHPSLCVFQINRCWPAAEESHMVILWAHTHEQLPWYTHKESLNRIVRALGHEPIVYHKRPADDVCWAEQPWWSAPRTAQLTLGGHAIGYFGSLAPQVCAQLGFADMLVAQISLSVLSAIPVAAMRYQEPSRYQSVSSDVSILVPYGVTYDQIVHDIQQADARIYDIHLVDRYEHVVQQGYTALTIGYRMVDPAKTLDKEHLDALRASVTRVLAQRGIMIRT